MIQLYSTSGGFTAILPAVFGFFCSYSFLVREIVAIVNRPHI